jgi:Tfp pilus assembly protein PilV
MPAGLPCRSGPRLVGPSARGQAGISLVEILAASLVIGIAVIGIALMFGTGSGFVAASGDDRVAAGLAQQRIEQIRAGGWGALGTEAHPIGAVVADPDIVAGNNRVFQREVCIQYVDPTTAEGLVNPPYDPSCPAGPPTAMARITVTVRPPRPDVSPVTLQAWLSQAGP